MRMKKKKYLPKILLAVFLAGYFSFAYFVGIECMYLKYFHIICPGCGMTRALRALVNLDFAEAFSYHPMVFCMPLVIVYIFTNGRLFKNKKIDDVILICIAVGFVINYVIKLIAFFA